MVIIPRKVGRGRRAKKEEAAKIVLNKYSNKENVSFTADAEETLETTNITIVRSL
jgi:hypothetical protein